MQLVLLRLSIIPSFPISQCRPCMNESVKGTMTSSLWDQCFWGKTLPQDLHRRDIRDLPNRFSTNDQLRLFLIHCNREDRYRASTEPIVTHEYEGRQGIEVNDGKAGIQRRNKPRSYLTSTVVTCLRLRRAHVLCRSAKHLVLSLVYR
ncbi:hypothetical protein B0T20DRAFT_252040 [Sordaria brevicollis]|uniref:Uncharacterized protein n=1 Tax=Sordaria brevicollis TaxID=83679 RepID=A0AAE0PC63_SORBR|nr:hypothetical protein B0T20DRAFT_252040 [Sordaria brevicollis]